MTRIAALMVWAASTVLQVAASGEASLRGAETLSAEGAPGGIHRVLDEADEYAGCFADRKERVIPDMWVKGDMTPALCRSHCEDKGAMYYATQYANECFCGHSNEGSDYKIYGSATCDKPCAGDDSIDCGGTWAFSLYKIANDEPTAPAPTPDDDYSGGQYGTEYAGDATYYGYTTEGNCAFGGNVPEMYSGMIPIALNALQYGDSLMCGACVEGTASGVGAGSNPIPSTFKGYMTDKCPECSWGDLDFSVSGDGRWDIEWEFIACPGEDIAFKFEGSNQWYWKLQPQGTKRPVKSLTINGKAASRTDDNHFVLEGGPWYGSQTVVTTTVAGVTQTSQVSR